MSRSGLGPTTQRLTLGAELRRLREGAKLQVKDAAAHLECSPSRVSRIETGQSGVVLKARELRELAALYGLADKTQIEALLRILRESQQEGWWAQFEDVLPSGLEPYVGLETGAVSERAFEPLLVHGLLQTEDYARALLTASGRPHDDVEQLVELRMRRKALLSRVDPLHVWLVVDEAALRKPIGGARVMRAQVEHMAQLVAEMSNVTVQVLPGSTGAHTGLRGGFSILEFDPPNRPVVYVDCPAGNLYVQQPATVRKFARNLDLLRFTAPPPDKTPAALRLIAKELG